MTEFFRDFMPDSPLEAIITVHYPEKREIFTRDFFSKYDDPKIYSRDYSELRYSNVMTLKIEPTQKQWISNWNKPKDTGRTQNSNFESGYSLIVRFDLDDTNLRSYVIERLSEFEFGSLPGIYTLHCHKNDPAPTEKEAKVILQSIIERICGKYDYLGFDDKGLHRNGTEWDDQGFNNLGIHKNGTKWNDQGFNNLGIHKNGTKWNDQGFNKDSYNEEGINYEELHKNGDFLDDKEYDP